MRMQLIWVATVLLASPAIADVSTVALPGSFQGDARVEGFAKHRDVIFEDSIDAPDLHRSSATQPYWKKVGIAGWEPEVWVQAHTRTQLRFTLDRVYIYNYMHSEAGIQIDGPGNSCQCIQDGYASGNALLYDDAIDCKARYYFRYNAKTGF